MKSREKGLLKGLASEKDFDGFLINIFSAVDVVFVVLKTSPQIVLKKD